MEKATRIEEEQARGEDDAAEEEGDQRGNRRRQQPENIENLWRKGYSMQSKLTMKIQIRTSGE